MSAEHVRFVGIIVAVLFAGYGILRYRFAGSSRFDLLLALLIALGVAIVSVFPQIGEIFVGLFGLENRALALLSSAVLILFGLFLYLLGQVRNASRRSGEIVTGVAVRGYVERHLTSEDVPAQNRENGKILIVIPAYDEEGGIRDMLRRVPKELMGYEIKTVVVNDGSTDATEAIALEEGSPVATHVVNRGQGDALRTGFEIARVEQADIVINLDADGQYQPEEMKLLIEPIMQDEADFVLGSRFLGYYEEAGSVRHIGVLFFSKLISILTRTSISDCTNGFRAIRVSMLQNMNLVEDRFNATEIILEALKGGLRFHEVPISMLKRSAGETKKPPRLAYPFGVFRVIIRTWLR